MMSRDVVAVNASASALSAAQELRRDHLTNLPVINNYMEVVGSVGEASLRGRGGRTVAEVMTRPARTIDEGRPISEAAELLLKQRLSSLLVVCHGKLVGRVSRRGLVTYLCQHQWVCSHCGISERGTRPPVACAWCGGPQSGFQFQEAVPGD
jgi:CBS domain-containing protein